MAQILEVVTFLASVVILAIKLVYHIMESLYITFYNLFVPVKSAHNETVLITGAGHGIGKELALQYASLGAKLVCIDINNQANQETMDEIKKIAGNVVFVYHCDISDPQQVYKMAKKVKEDVGEITILVNNAGIMPTQTLLRQSEELIKKQMDINIMSHFWMLKAFLPRMIENNHGHIIAISSMTGLIGLPNMVPYCTAKFAVRGLMETLQEELRLNSKKTSQIKFTTIFPYMVDTGLCKKPKIKYPSLMPLQSPKYVAEKIIKTQQKNLREVSVPSFWLPLITFLRNLPYTTNVDIRNFIDTYVEEDE